MHLDLLHPILDIVEGVAIVDGVGEYNAHCSFVVSLSDGLEPFLACSVPDLQLYPRSAHAD